MIYIDCEWDLGQKDLVFATKGDALEWLEKNWIHELGPLDEALYNRQIAFIPLEVYSEGKNEEQEK
jgi:hypothetical protein